METTKYTELKAELNNKNLSREERSRIAQRMRYEAYKADKRKPIGVYRRTKLSCMFYLSFSAAQLYALISFHAFPKDKDVPIDIALFLALFVTAFVFGFRYMMNLASYKPEPDDELAAQNRAKSGEAAFYLWYAVAVLLVSFVLIFKDRLYEPFVVSDFMLTSCGMFMLYQGLKDLVFLLLDGSPEEESEDEQ